jgi:DNA-binding GntR family transcriptional regulator
VLQRPETLTSAVARYIRDAIMRGEYAPGRALPEVWLAEPLQTSRGTIREAFRTLADQGLVETFPHRGSFVASLTPRRARELYTLRAELESYAVRLVMERGGYSAEARAALHAALDRLRVDPVGADQYELAEADMQLHDLLTRESDHQVLLEVLDSLRLQMRQFIVSTKLMGSDEEPEHVTHGRLLAAVESGDPARAAAAVRHHIHEAGKLLLSKLEAEDADGPAGPAGPASRMPLPGLIPALTLRSASSTRLRSRRSGDVVREESKQTGSDRTEPDSA